MNIEVLIGCIEMCVNIAKKASDDHDNELCSAYYALGVYEECINSISRYVNEYKEGKNEHTEQER